MALFCDNAVPHDNFAIAHLLPNKIWTQYFHCLGTCCSDVSIGLSLSLDIQAFNAWPDALNFTRKG